jgi:hypothetical protein
MRGQMKPELSHVRQDIQGIFMNLVNSNVLVLHGVAGLKQAVIVRRCQFLFVHGRQQAQGMTKQLSVGRVSAISVRAVPRVNVMKLLAQTFIIITAAVHVSECEAI